MGDITVLECMNQTLNALYLRYLLYLTRHKIGHLFLKTRDILHDILKIYLVID